MKIRAKFMCGYVEKLVTDGVVRQENIHMYAVHANSPENATWATATPGGNLTMSISNPSAIGAFEQGKEYFLDFTPASSE